MALELSYKPSYQRYQLVIPPRLWADFFAQLTDENQGRLMTLRQRHPQLGEVEILGHSPLVAAVYGHPNQGGDLVIMVSQPQDSGEITYTHRIALPQAVSIVTDDDGVVQACRIAAADQAQTILSFQA